MSKHNPFIDAKWFKVASLIVGSVLSHLALAENLVANTPANQSDYEPLHQGRIQVRASLFSAPCNLFVEKTLNLTECGAGKDYREMNLFEATANIPVSVRFVDVQRGLSSGRYPLSLLNGNNPIQLPSLMKDLNRLRLEVSYE